MAEEEKKYGVTEPNRGLHGKLASNMTGEAIEGNYDYGDKVLDRQLMKRVRILEYPTLVFLLI